MSSPAAPVPDTTMAALFTAAVARDPAAPALRSDTGICSYAAVDEQSNQLARILIQDGVGGGDIVALAVPRGLPELVIAVLAVTKAGAAYLPVDPSYPAERIAYLLADAQPTAMLTIASVAAQLPRLAAGRRLRVLDHPKMLRALRALAATAVTPGELLRPVRPTDVAYLIYTSGSTGAPKGVMVTHAGLACLVSTVRQRLNTGPGARVLQFASPSFDASVFELAMSVLSGGELVLAPGGHISVGRPLLATLTQHAVTHLVIPPSVLAACPELPDQLISLMVAGEACPVALVDRWSPGRTMVNGYGPTETTVCATISAPLRAGAVTPPPIGTSVSGAQIRLLDARLRPPPATAPGELYIAGKGLARGYLNQPGLTAQRFIADPGGPPGARMYRTGDLALAQADGFHYRGRSDNQIKVRGFRIEPGEIEAALQAQPGVLRAAVLARPGVGLVAFVSVSRGGPGAATLRQALAGRLPVHLVPSDIRLCDQLPLTPNGKIDRRALAGEPTEVAK